jgi:hypothetical protein
MGVIFYEVLIGKAPDYFIFNTLNGTSKVDSNDIFFPPVILKFIFLQTVRLSNEMKDLIKAMLVKEEEGRIGILEVVTRLDFLLKKEKISENFEKL